MVQERPRRSAPAILSLPPSVQGEITTWRPCLEGGKSGFAQKPQPRWARLLRRILTFTVTTEPVDPNAPVTATYTITFPGAASAIIAIATFDDALSCKGESHKEHGRKWMHQRAFWP
jgi:hypothetical protein